MNQIRFNHYYFLFRSILLSGIAFMLSMYTVFGQDRFVIADPGQRFNDIVQLPNTQFVASGIDHTLVLTQVDTTGNINWSKSYTDTSCINFIEGSAICSLYDNSMVVSGNRLMSTQPNVIKSVLTKVDSAGNVVWSFTSSAPNSVIYNVVATKDSCILVAYYTSQIHVMKLNSQGNILWLKNYSLSGDIVATDDNGFIMYWSDLNYMYINKFDSQGNQTWGGKWTGGGLYTFLQWQRMIQCANGGYACIAAITDQQFGNYHEAVFLRLNPNGTTYSVTLLDSVHANENSFYIHEKTNGDFIVTTYDKIVVLNPSGYFVTSKRYTAPRKLTRRNPESFIAYTENSILKLDSTLSTCCSTAQVISGNTSAFSLTRYTYNQFPVVATDTLVPVNLTVTGNDSTYYMCSDNHIPGNIHVRSLSSPYICEGMAVPLVLYPYPSCFNYQWKFNGTIIPHANDRLFYASDSGYYSCVISNSNGSFETDPFLLVVYPKPPISLTTSSLAPAFCVNDSVLVYTDSTSASYLWLPDSSTGPSIYVDSTGVYSVISTSAYGCTRQEQILIREDSVPPQIPALIHSGVSTCIGSSHYLIAGTSGTGYFYHWIRDSISIYSSFSYTYTLNLQDAGNYYCIVANGCGSDATDSVYLLPVAPTLPVIQPGTDVEICRGDSVILTTSQGYSYYWRIDYPPNNSLLIGNDTLITDSAQIYKLYYTDSAGCLTITNVQVSLLGPVITNATHSDSLCYDASALLLDCTPLGGIYSGTAISADHFEPSLASPGWNTYQYALTDTSGCTFVLEDSLRIYIPTVIPATHADSICFNHSPVFLNCLPPGGIYTGAAIDTGYFQPTLAVPGWNIYQYESTDNLGCSALFIDSLFVSTCASIEESTTKLFRFYPNPVKNELVIDNANADNCVIQIYSLEGKLIEQLKLEGNEKLNFPVSFSAGIYLLDVKWPGVQTHYQFIKL